MPLAERSLSSRAAFLNSPRRKLKRQPKGTHHERTEPRNRGAHQTEDHRSEFSIRPEAHRGTGDHDRRLLRGPLGRGDGRALVGEDALRAAGAPADAAAGPPARVAVV